MAKLVVSVSLVAVLTACGGLHTRVFLDATTAKVEPEAGHTLEFPGTSGCASGSSGGIVSTCQSAVQPPYPLRVKLLKTDSREYRRMSRIRYDVSLTNVSRDAVVFPWSPLPINRRDRPPTGYRHALFELMLKKNGYDDAVADTFALYGAPTVAGSLRVVHPGETVVVRLPGIFSGSGYQDARNPVLYPDRDMRLKVGLSMFAPGDVRFEVFHTEPSDNALPIKILRSGV